MNNNEVTPFPTEAFSAGIPGSRELFVDRTDDRSAARLSWLENERDIVLLDHIVQGSTSALLELYDAHYREAFRRAFSVVSDLDCAERAVRDAFLALRSEGATFCAGHGSVKTWLLTQVNTFASEELRKHAPATSLG